MTPEAKRAAAAERKRKSRAGKTEILLPLPQGTAEALLRVMVAAGFDDARDFLSFQIHRLDFLLARDGHMFEQQAKRTVTVTGLEKYNDRLLAEGASDDH